MLGLQQGFDGLRKSDDVRVAAYQLDFAFGKADNLDNVDRTNLGGVLIQFVEVGYNLLFIGNGYIESTEIGVFFNHFHEVFDAGNLEVHIFGVDVLCFKFLVEVADGERMFQRVTD